MVTLEGADWTRNLVARRKALGLTQVQVAQLAGCSHAVVVRIEQGRTTVAIRNLLAVLRVLGFTLALTDLRSKILE